MSRRLEGRVALVTGGASGLGEAIALRLSAEGAVVFISDVQSEQGLSTAHNHNFQFLQQDVSDEHRWQSVINEVETKGGRLNILINNAGILGPMEAVNPENTQLDAWRKIFQVNVEGTFLGCRTAIAAMRRTGGGSIVNISSGAGLVASPNTTAYGASKAAVRHLTKSVAQYCAEQRLDIRCNSVHPGIIRTPLLDKSIAELAAKNNVTFDAMLTRYRGLIPLGELTEAADVAAAVAFLVSNDARHITGSRLSVDGGTIDCDSFHMRLG